MAGYIPGAQIGTRCVQTRSNRGLRRQLRSDVTQMVSARSVWRIAPDRSGNGRVRRGVAVGRNQSSPTHTLLTNVRRDLTHSGGWSEGDPGMTRQRLLAAPHVGRTHKHSEATMSGSVSSRMLPDLKPILRLCLGLGRSVGGGVRQKPLESRPRLFCARRQAIRSGGHARPRLDPGGR